MKIYFITYDTDLVQLASLFAEEDSCVLSWEDSIPDVLPSELSVFFLDFDHEEMLARQRFADLRSFENVRLVLVTSKMSPKQVREHQASEQAADSYLFKPLSFDDVQEVIEDFNKSWSPDHSSSQQEGEPYVELAIASEVRELIDMTVSQTTDLSHPLQMKLQEKINAVFGSDLSEQSMQDENSLSEENMSTKQNETSQTLTEKFGGISEGNDADLDLDLDLNLDLGEGAQDETPDLPTSDAESSDLDLDLSEDEGVQFDEVSEEATQNAGGDEISEDLDLDLDLGLDGEEAPPHVPTETKIKPPQKLQAQESQSADDFEVPPSVPASSSFDLEAELVGESSESDFNLNDSPEAPASFNKEESEDLDIDLDEEDDFSSAPVSKTKPVNSIKETEPEMIFSSTPVQMKGSVSADSEFDSSPSFETPANFDRVVSSGGSEDLVRLQTTLRHLRAEREQLLKEASTLKTEKKLLEQDNLGYKAEIDELKIELSIVKKRNNDELADLRYKLRVAEEKKALFEEKVKTFQKEFDKMNQKVRVDINQVKQREKDLEGKLELMAMDSAQQIQSRDNKILELKRKIDALEFNMENISIQEQKAKDDKNKVEDRLVKIVKTLRGSIKLLEDDIDLNHDFLEDIKKL